MYRIHKISKDIIFVFTVLLATSIIYSIISVLTHNRYMTFGLDLGYFDEAIWKISHGIFPYSSSGCIWLLEDHFQVILYALAPLYKIWENVAVILIFQSIWMVFAGFPLYLLSKKITHSCFFSFTVMIAYLFFIGTQFAILNEFHQATFVPMFIVLLYSAVEWNKKFLFWFSILLLFFVKEDTALLVSTIGLGLIFRKDWRMRGLITAALGFLVFFSLVYIFMPLFSIKGVYAHFSHFKSAGGSTNIFELFQNILKNPSFIIEIFIGSSLKVKTLVTSLFAFSVLPIFAPLFILIPLLGDFLLRFLYEGPQITKWMLVNHHAASGAMLLALSCIYTAQRLTSKLEKSHRRRIFVILGSLLLIATLIQDIVLKAPIHSILKKDLYQKEQWMRDNDEIIAQVPGGVTVASQNNLVPHLTHRESSYRLPFGLNSDYILLDYHDGPNKYAPLNFEQMKKFVDEYILSNSRYFVLAKKGESMLLKRNFKTDITKSPYYNNTHYCYYSFEER